MKFGCLLSLVKDGAGVSGESTLKGLEQCRTPVGLISRSGGNATLSRDRDNVGLEGEIPLGFKRVALQLQSTENSSLG